MSYVLLAIPGVYRATSSMAYMWNSRSLDRISVTDEQFQPSQRARVDLLSHAGVEGDTPEFYPLPLLSPPAPLIAAPGPAYDLSRAFLEHLLNPANYTGYARAVARAQLATVANPNIYPPITPDQAIAEFKRPPPLFTCVPASTARPWCGPLADNKRLCISAFGDEALHGCWMRYDIETKHDGANRIASLHLPWFDFAPEVPPSLRAAAYAVFLDRTQTSVISDVWQAGLSPTHMKRAAKIVRYLAWSDFIHFKEIDLQNTLAAVQLYKKRQARYWSAEHLYMGVPNDSELTSMVLTPWAYEELQRCERQELDANARREEARLLHASLPNDPDRRGGRGRGRPPGAKNILSPEELHKRLLREQHPPFQPNVLQLMKARRLLPYDWSTSLSFVNPTANFTRCSPLLPGLCSAMPRTAINLMHPESLLWRNLIWRMQNIGKIRMGEEAFKAFYDRHPVVFDMQSLQPLHSNAAPQIRDEWREATMYVPLPTVVLGLLWQPLGMDLLRAILPGTCDESQFDPDQTDIRGYYDNDVLATSHKKPRGWKVPVNEIPNFQFDR